jgi:hypothetical protein
MYDYANDSLEFLLKLLGANLPNCKKYYRVYKQ